MSRSAIQDNLDKIHPATSPWEGDCAPFPISVQTMASNICEEACWMNESDAMSRSALPW